MVGLTFLSAAKKKKRKKTERGRGKRGEVPAWQKKNRREDVSLVHAEQALSLHVIFIGRKQQLKKGL